MTTHLETRVTHREVSKLIKDIVTDERQLYVAQCSGNDSKVQDLRQDLEFMNRKYWEKTGKTLHNGYQELR